MKSVDIRRRLGFKLASRKGPTCSVDVYSLAGHSHSTAPEFKRRSIFPSDELVMLESGPC
jgi:hypothetical protein